MCHMRYIYYTVHKITHLLEKKNSILLLMATVNREGKKTRNKTNVNIYFVSPVTLIRIYNLADTKQLCRTIHSDYMVYYFASLYFFFSWKSQSPENYT